MTSHSYAFEGPGGCRPSKHDVARGILMMTGRHGHHRGGGPGGGRGGFGPGFGPGGRGRRARGDVRAAVLLLLAEEPRNGYQLMQEIEERSGGVWRPSPGSTYPALAQLEDEGLVQATAVGTGREFALTDAGRTHVEENRETLGEPWTAASGGFPREGLELRGLIKQIGIASMQVMVAGTQAQREQAVQLLGEARRGLYRILAQEDDDSPADGGSAE
jgi:DNA-binding PadR family transcriptional regulator